MASMVQANQTNRAAPAIKAEAIAAHQTSAEPLPYPPPRAVESKSIYPPSRAREGRERAERIPLGIICVLAATRAFDEKVESLIVDSHDGEIGRAHV